MTLARTGNKYHFAAKGDKRLFDLLLDNVVNKSTKLSYGCRCYSIYMNQTVYQSVVYKEGKYYVAQCLNVDVSSFGESEQKALTNLQEALELYLEDAPSSATSNPVEHPTVHTLHLQHA